jgi:hypothetical protein
MAVIDLKVYNQENSGLFCAEALKCTNKGEPADHINTLMHVP